MSPVLSQPGCQFAHQSLIWPSVLCLIDLSINQHFYLVSGQTFVPSGIGPSTELSGCMSGDFVHSPGCVLLDARHRDKPPRNQYTLILHHIQKLTKDLTIRLDVIKSLEEPLKIKLFDIGIGSDFFLI